MATKRTRLARVRRSAGYTQEGLAERLGVDRSTVVRWELGNTAPQPWLQPRLAEVLGVSAAEFRELLDDADCGDGAVVSGSAAVASPDAAFGLAGMGRRAVSVGNGPAADGVGGYHELGLYCAQESQSWGLRSEILMDMGGAALIHDQADDALSLVELAEVRVDRIPPTRRVLLGARHARALAAAGRPADAVDRVLAAEDQRATITAVHDGHGSPFVEATAFDLSYELALAAVETAVRDVRFAPNALDRLQGILDNPELTGARSQARLTAKLADLSLRAGEVERGLAAPGRVIAVSEGLSSTVLTKDLRQLAGTLAQQGGPAAREFAALLDARLWQHQQP